MPSSQAIVATGHASKYLRQLCRHFAHKVSVDYDPAKGRVDFPFGDCRMQAAEMALTIDIAASGDDNLRRLQFVIVDHLARFAWREKPAIVWQPGEWAGHER